MPVIEVSLIGSTWMTCWRLPPPSRSGALGRGTPTLKLCSSGAKDRDGGSALLQGRSGKAGA